MRQFTLFISIAGVLILYGSTCRAQNCDVIYLKTGITIQCKIREVSLVKVRYTRPEIKRSPFYEVKKDDVFMLEYKDGHIDIIDEAFYKSSINRQSKVDTTIELPDTTCFSTLFILYESHGSIYSTFPLYINDKYICTLTEYSRLEYRLKSQGRITISRKEKNEIGPSRTIETKHGGIYGVSVNVSDKTTKDPSRRFSMVTYTGLPEVKNFLETEYSKKKVSKNLDFHTSE
jgi:hypothetical protein